MRSETISIHGGFQCDPATKAVAVPIYQNVAYEFESADHGAALFNLEVDGFRYSRISNPTTDILERRVAENEGPLHAVLEFTYVARPGMLPQCHPGERRETLLAAGLRVEFGQEVLCKQIHIVAAAAHRRQINRKHS